MRQFSLLFLLARQIDDFVEILPLFVSFFQMLFHVFLPIETGMLFHENVKRVRCSRHVREEPYEPINDLLTEIFSGRFIFSIDFAVRSVGTVPVFDSLNPNHSILFREHSAFTPLYRLIFVIQNLQHISHLPPMAFRRPPCRYKEVIQIHMNPRQMPHQIIHYSFGFFGHIA